MDISATLSKNYPDAQIGALHVVKMGSRVPDNETRKGLVKLIDTYGHDLSCIAMVLEGSGFWASAIRSFAFGLGLVTRFKITMSIFSTPEDAVEWFSDKHTLPGDAKVNRVGLLSAVRELRAELDRAH